MATMNLPALQYVPQTTYGEFGMPTTSQGTTLTPESLKQVWTVLSKGQTTGLPTRQPTSGELRAYNTITEGGFSDPMTGEWHPVDQYGWTQNRDGSYRNVWSEYIAPAGTKITAQTVGVPPPDKPSSGLGTGIGFIDSLTGQVGETLGDVGQWTSDNASWLIPLLGAGAMGAAGYASYLPTAGAGGLSAAEAGMLGTEGFVPGAATFSPGTVTGGALTGAGTVAPAVTGGGAIAPAVTGGAGMLSSAPSWLGPAAIIGAPLIAGALAPTGGQTVSNTSTTSNIPSYMQDDAEKMWEDYINSFYGTGGTPGYQQRLGENVAYQKGIENTYNQGLTAQGQNYLQQSTAAASPYQKLLEAAIGRSTEYQDLLSGQIQQANAGTGMFTPTNISFGGNPLMSFVPRSNRDLAQQVSTMGQDRRNAAGTAANFGLSGSQVAQGLADLQNVYQTATIQRNYDLAAGHPPNEVQDAYFKQLQDLMFKLNTGNQTKTETGTVPGPSTWSNILQGLNVGANLYGQIAPWQPQPMTTTNNTNYYTTPQV